MRWLNRFIVIQEHWTLTIAPICNPKESHRWPRPWGSNVIMTHRWQKLPIHQHSPHFSPSQISFKPEVFCFLDSLVGRCFVNQAWAEFKKKKETKWINNNPLLHIHRVFQCHSLYQGSFFRSCPATAYLFFQRLSNAYFTKNGVT